VVVAVAIEGDKECAKGDFAVARSGKTRVTRLLNVNGRPVPSGMLFHLTVFTVKSPNTHTSLSPTMMHRCTGPWGLPSEGRAWRGTGQNFMLSTISAL
jgi:hypothetical protein